jgi:hypothetical protein
MTARLWALDLDKQGRPVYAHLIVDGAETEQRIAACGRVFTRYTHMRGWWWTPLDELPLQPHAIHCGVPA